MTYQRDPERPISDGDLERREMAEGDAELAGKNADEADRFNPIALILTLLVLCGIGYFFYHSVQPRQPVTRQTTENSQPSAFPTPAPVPPVAPVAPQTK